MQVLLSKVKNAVFGELCRAKKLTCNSRHFMLNEEMIGDVIQNIHV